MVIPSVLYKGLARLTIFPIFISFLKMPNYTENSIIDNPLVFIVLSFIPTLLLWFGLQLKIKREFTRKLHLLIIYIACFLIFIATLIVTNIYKKEVLEIKLSYDSKQVFLVERYLKNFYLYTSDLNLKNKKLIYSGISYPGNLSPNPCKPILFFTYEKTRKDKILPDYVVCVYDLKSHRYLVKRTQEMSISHGKWSQDGEHYYYLSYKGFQVINLNELNQINLTVTNNFPIKNDFLCRCFDWTKNEDQIAFVDSNESSLHIFDLNNKKIKQLLKINGNFEQVDFVDNDKSLLYLYSTEVFTGYIIELMNLETEKSEKIYNAPIESDDFEGEGNGVKIDKLFFMRNHKIIFSEYESDDDGQWAEVTIYLLDITNKKISQIFKTNSFYSLWDYNYNSGKLVFLRNNHLEIIDEKNLGI